MRNFTIFLQCQIKKKEKKILHRGAFSVLDCFSVFCWTLGENTFLTNQKCSSPLSYKKCWVTRILHCVVSLILYMNITLFILCCSYVYIYEWIPLYVYRNFSNFVKENLPITDLPTHVILQALRKAERANPVTRS